MIRIAVPRLCLGLCTAGLISSVAFTTTQAAAPKPAPDISIIHVQVILDHLGFSPGVIDGLEGESLKLALTGFQTANGLAKSGKMDRPTLAAIARFRATRPLRIVALTAADIAGPYSGPIPKDPAAQARMPALGYANVVEKLTEQYHTSTATLIALNPGARLHAGATLRVPNVIAASQAYPDKLPPEWRQTLAGLNVNATQPEGKRVVVDKSDGTLRVYDAADALVAQFPATMGSEHDPLPIGKWTIKGASYNPSFHYNPDLFWDAKSNDTKQKLPAGPNGPVGVIWLDLSKPHYGIHGTPHPETIGRAESHGCIRLTNWDAARLSLMVKPGTPAVFQP